MKHVDRYIYDIASGEIIYRFSGLLIHLASNVHTGQGDIEASRVTHPETQRVIYTDGNLTVVDYQPPPPSPDHIWDTATRRWVVHPDVQARWDRVAEILKELAALDVASVRINEDLTADPGNPEALQRFNDMRSKKDTLRVELRSLRSAG